MFLEQDYAKTLSVHVNHLNRSVKEITDKAATNHIAERIITEAKRTPPYTDRTIADIAYSMGFEYPPTLITIPNVSRG